MCFVKYFQNFYENRCNYNAPVFFHDAGCIHLCMEWTPLMHVWFLLPTSIERWKAKRKRAQLIKPKHDVISAHTTPGRKYRNEI